MGYAISIDWCEERDNHPDKWVNHGRDLLNASCKHKKGVQENGYCEKCEISEDANEPMLNFIYPLDCEPNNDPKMRY